MKKFSFQYNFQAHITKSYIQSLQSKMNIIKNSMLNGRLISSLMHLPNKYQKYKSPTMKSGYSTILCIHVKYTEYDSIF